MVRSLHILRMSHDININKPREVEKCGAAKRPTFRNIARNVRNCAVRIRDSQPQNRTVLPGTPGNFGHRLVVEQHEELWMRRRHRSRQLWKRVSFQYLRVIEGIVFLLPILPL